ESSPTSPRIQYSRRTRRDATLPAGLVPSQPARDYAGGLTPAHGQRLGEGGELAPGGVEAEPRVVFGPRQATPGGAPRRAPRARAPGAAAPRAAGGAAGGAPPPAAPPAGGPPPPPPAGAPGGRPPDPAAADARVAGGVVAVALHRRPRRRDHQGVRGAAADAA